MKFKVLNRNKDDYIAKKGDRQRVFRNPDPKLHPFERAREYTRALNATKLDKVFAKPFVGALSGHSDSVWRLATVPKQLSTICSGSCDGELLVWKVPQRKVGWQVKAHRGFVRGLAIDRESKNILTAGDDLRVKVWSLDQSTILVDSDDEDDIAEEKYHATSSSTSSSSSRRKARTQVKPLHEYRGKAGFLDLDHQHGGDLFATSGKEVSIWDKSRAEPLHSFNWGIDSINIVKFNRVENNILSSAASDRNIVLYDIRSHTPIRKLVMKMSTNSLCWNPMEAYNFTTACEDANLYTFDMRKLQQAMNVHQDHVTAVMSVDYSPTGREFVSGSYDRTVRIWRVTDGRSREVYHTKRMQRIFSVKFSADSTFVYSGSDDTNVRVWKSNASQKLGTLLPREKQKLRYQESLKKRYRHMPEIRRIARHRQLPKGIYKAKQTRHIMLKSAKRKEANRRAHSKPGSIPFKQERKKHIVAEEE